VFNSKLLPNANVPLIFFKYGSKKDGIVGTKMFRPGGRKIGLGMLLDSTFDMFESTLVSAKGAPFFLSYSCEKKVSICI